MRPKFLLQAAILIILSACSLTGGYRNTELTQAAVLRVAGEYIGYVVQRNVNQLDGLVLWADYIENKGIDKTAYFTQLAELPPFPTDETNPLLGLDLDSLDVDGDDAEVILVKKGVEGAEKIEVRLVWVGQGWLVVDDSLFGPKQYLADLAKAHGQS